MIRKFLAYAGTTLLMAACTTTADAQFRFRRSRPATGVQQPVKKQNIFRRLLGRKSAKDVGRARVQAVSGIRQVNYAPRSMVIDGTPQGGQSGMPVVGTPVFSGSNMYPAEIGYPYLNAPLYSSPSQNVPIQTGASIITNQALAPHEMLYPHKYKAMYPPFYYKVRGHWWVWPWGVESYDKWELQGTEVEVKYRSSINIFSGFTPPVLR